MLIQINHSDKNFITIYRIRAVAEHAQYIKNLIIIVT